MSSLTGLPNGSTNGSLDGYSGQHTGPGSILYAADDKGFMSKANSGLTKEVLSDEKENHDYGTGGTSGKYNYNNSNTAAKNGALEHKGEEANPPYYANEKMTAEGPGELDSLDI